MNKTSTAAYKVANIPVAFSNVLDLQAIIKLAYSQ
jgi:hypothetical protein